MTRPYEQYHPDGHNVRVYRVIYIKNWYQDGPAYPETRIWCLNCRIHVMQGSFWWQGNTHVYYYYDKQPSTIFTGDIPPSDQPCELCGKNLHDQPEVLNATEVLQRPDLSSPTSD